MSSCKLGVEIQPLGSEEHLYRGDFCDIGGEQLGRIYISAGGRGGARLLGARHFGHRSITTLTITDISTAVEPAGFAITALRFGASEPHPTHARGGPAQRSRLTTLRRSVPASSISPD